MTDYIALLRGVNVGGKNIVAMPLLKAAFERCGFTEVSTYTNSGNVLFSCLEEDIAVLQQKCRQGILESFGFSVEVAVISAENLSEALRHAPKWWGTDREAKHMGIFSIAPATVQEVIAAVGAIKPEYEKVEHFGILIFWSAPLKTFSKTRWGKVAGTAAYHSITVRNANTTQKLLQLSMERANRRKEHAH